MCCLYVVTVAPARYRLSAKDERCNKDRKIVQVREARKWYRTGQLARQLLFSAVLRYHKVCFSARVGVGII
jgi:hypothetical protein